MKSDSVFQASLSLPQFYLVYGTEQKMFEVALEQARWPLMVFVAPRFVEGKEYGLHHWQAPQALFRPELSSQATSRPQIPSWRQQKLL